MRVDQAVVVFVARGRHQRLQTARIIGGTLGAHEVDVALRHLIDPASAQRQQLLGMALVVACAAIPRSEEHTSELQSLMRNSYAVLCFKKKTRHTPNIPK